ncbi:MAG: C1 family peptidase, partial [Clostridiales bacterium]|nr:C1 family peptidase [Clostridiales bacterium]
SLNTTSLIAKADETSKYDPRQLELVTPVKNQSTYGVCWDFAGMAALESYLLKNNYGNYDLSEEHLRLWATLNKNGCGWNRISTEGAATMTAPGYFTSYKGGVKLESDIPYKSYGMYSEYPEELEKIKGIYRADNIEYIDNNMKSVKDAIIKYGAVVTTLYYSTSFLNKSTSAYNCKSNMKYLSNHNVTIVGWDDNYSKDNFKEEDKPLNNGAFLVKNSQGPLYSEAGYLWVSYEDEYILNEDNNKVNYSIKSVEKVNENSKIYEYDDYGATTNLILKTNNEKVQTMTYANVFNFSKDYNILDKVMINTVSKGAKYKLYYGKVLDNKPVVDKTMILLDEGIIKFKGYMTFDFNDIKIPEGKGAIVLQLDNSNNNSEVSLGVESNINYTNGSKAYIAEAEKGESFVYENNNPIDINEAFTDSKRSLSIKAINKKSEENTTPNVNKNLEIKKYYENKINKNNVLGSVRLNINASGGEGPLKYKFIVYKDGKCVFSCKYRDKNNIIWKPKAKGKYTICYRVKDNTGKEVKKSKEYNV